MFGKTTQGIEKSAKATAAISANLFVKFGADDDHIAVCSAATDGIIGVTVEAATVAEQQTRIALDGEIVDLLIGGNVTRGDWLTSDANGAGVAATRHTHTENTASIYAQNATTGAAAAVIAGARALASGVSGDIIPALVCPKPI
jgi:hypothetical protein